MKDLHKLFEESGITEEELVQYFLEPIYPEQNPTIIENIVYTVINDGSGNLNKVSQGPIEDILEEHWDLFISFLKDRNIEEEIFIEWMAHHKTSSFDEKGLQKTAREKSDLRTPSQQFADNVTTQEVPRTQEETVRKEDSRSALREILGGLKGILPALGQRIRNILPRKDGGDPSGVMEGRVLADEEKMETAEEEHSNTQELINLVEARNKERTKKLAKEINIVDAIYDNIGIIAEAIITVAETIEQSAEAQKEEKQSAREAKKALKDVKKVSCIGLTEDGNLYVECKQKEADRQASSVRLVGRLCVVRDKIQKTAAQQKTNSMETALKGIGKVSLGAGGKDADKVERSKTPNEPKMDKDKSKEIS